MLNLLVLRSNDITHLANFYSLLDFEFQYHNHGNGPFHYSSERNGFVFEIYPNNEEINKTTRIRLGVEVNDMESTMASLISKAIKVIRLPKQTEYGLIAIIEDPDGRRIELKEKVR